MTIKERPILFSGPMVRALLDGSKTQTRRVMKRQPPAVIQDGYLLKVYWPARDKHMSSRGDRAYLQFELPGEYDGRHIMKDGYGFECPHGQPGDRLWVRETWIDLTGTGIERSTGDHGRYAYGADTPSGSYGDQCRKDYGLKWRPSIHMPRAASRITLEVTGVRVERLRDISVADCLAEGIPSIDTPGAWSEPIPREPNLPAIYKGAFFALWGALNGDESWEANPWVWVVEFKRVT